MNSNILVERKLYEILKAVGIISERIDKLNKKLENFDRCITKLEYLVEEKISKFQQELKTKADDSALNELHLKIHKIEQQQVDQLTKDVMQESYEKRFNLLINEIEETDTSVWGKARNYLTASARFYKTWFANKRSFCYNACQLSSLVPTSGPQKWHKGKPTYNY